jgi:hypothetical protein
LIEFQIAEGSNGMKMRGARKESACSIKEKECTITLLEKTGKGEQHPLSI